MKKIIVGLIGLTFLFIAAAAFPYTSGMSGNTTGQMSAQQQFLEQTKALRQERHTIRCELQAASQAANPDQQKIAGLKNELVSIRGEIQAKAKELGVTMGSGNCVGGNCGSNRPLNCSGLTQQ